MTRANDNLQLQINPSIPGNALAPKSTDIYQHPAVLTPSYTQDPIGTEVPWAQIEAELWGFPIKSISGARLDLRSSTQYWLNLALGAEKKANRSCILIKLKFPQKNTEDFYHLAFQKWTLLNANSRCNLLCHREDFLLIVLNNPEKYPNFLDDETWMSLFNESGFSEKIKELAEKNVGALTLLLKYYDFNTLEELNNFLNTATLNYLDFRTGRSERTIKLEEWITFLNSLTKENRLLYLKSNHPLNAYSWEQIARLERFTVEDALDIIKRKGRALPDLSRPAPTRTLDDIDDDVLLIRDAESVALEQEQRRLEGIAEEERAKIRTAFLNKRLDQYIAEQDISFSVDEFLEMRGEKISASDFLRVICDDFSFDDFIYFLQKCEKDTSKINGLFACFFNFFMKNPALLIEQVDNDMAPHHQLINALFDITESFNDVVRCARFAKEGLVANGRAQLEDPNAAVVVLGNDRWYNKGRELVITNKGSARTSALLGENYDALIESAQLLIRAGKEKEAAREYCVALAIKVVPTILRRANDLIKKNNLTELYDIINERVKNHISGLLLHFNAAQATHDNKLSTFNEIFDFINELSTIESLFDTLDNVIRTLSFLTDGIIQVEKSRTQSQDDTVRAIPSRKPELLTIWKKYLSYASEEKKLGVFIRCITLDLSYQNKLFFSEEIKSFFKEFKGIYTEQMIKDRLMLEILLKPVDKLIETVNSYLPSAFNERKRFLLSLSISLEKVCSLSKEIVDRFLTPYGIELSDDEKFKIVTLFSMIAANNDSSHLNDVRLARELYYSEKASEDDDFYSIAINALSTVWRNATKNASIHFIFSGEENGLLEQFIHCDQSPVNFSSENLSRRELDNKYQWILSVLIRNPEFDFLKLVTKGLIIDDMKDYFSNNLLLLEIIFLHQLQLNQTIAKMLSTASQKTLDTLFLQLFENLRTRIDTDQLEPNMLSIYIFIINQFQSKKLQKNRFNSLLKLLFLKNRFEEIQFLLKNPNGEPVQIFITLIDPKMMVDEFRSALSCQPIAREKLNFLKDEIFPLLNFVDDPVLKFTISLEEYRLYQSLSAPKPFSETSTQAHPEKYDWLVVRMIMKRNCTALITLYELGANLAIQNTNNTMYLSSFIIDNYSYLINYPVFTQLLLLLPDNMNDRLLNEIVLNELKKWKRTNIDLIFALLNGFSDVVAKQKKFNQLLQAHIRADMIMGIDIFVKRYPSTWIDLNTHAMLIESLEKCRGDDTKTRTILAILIYSNINPVIHPETKFKLFLVLCTPNSEVYLPLVNMLLTTMREEPVVLSNSENRCSLAIAVFNNAHHPGFFSRLSKEPEMTHQIYLQKIYHHGVNENGKGTLAALQQLGWINKSGRSTDLSPISFGHTETQENVNTVLAHRRQCF